MKKLISLMLAAAVVMVSAAAVFAEDTAYTLTVNGTKIDLSDLPRAIYENDGHIMIPRRISDTVLSGTRRRETLL